MSGYIPDACCGLTAPNPFEIRNRCFRFLSRLRRLLYCFCRQGQKLLRIVDRHMTLYSRPLPMDAQKPAFCKGYERLIVHTAATASKGKASAPGIWNAPACPSDFVLIRLIDRTGIYPRQFHRLLATAILPPTSRRLLYLGGG